MDIFDNLLIELAGESRDSCGGDCYDVCSGVSQDITNCSTSCTESCEGTSGTGGGGNGADGACLVCFSSCSGACRFGCGALVCGTQAQLDAGSSK